MDKVKLEELAIMIDNSSVRLEELKSQVAGIEVAISIIQHDIDIARDEILKAIKEEDIQQQVKEQLKTC